MIIFERAAKYAAIFGFFLLLSSGYAQAEEKLTRNNIKEFIKETTALTSGQKKDVSNDEIAFYLENHLDPDARFKSVVTFAMPGFPAQERELSVNKEEFIEQTLSGEKALGDYKNKIRVGSIKIAKNGRRASVKTTGIETGTMAIPNAEGGSEDVPVEGVSSCDQILKLSDSGNIQMYNANCKTTIEFEQF